MPDYRPATPALDLLTFIGGRAETPGYDDVLSKSDLATISQIITAQDERRARSQLIRMQARLTDRAFLEPEDLARLEAITGPSKPPTRKLSLHLPTRIAVALLATAIVAGLVAGIRAWVDSGNAGGAPPPAAAPANPPAAQVPAPGYTDLQLFRRDWGPWQQLTPSDAAPQTGAPGLLLLQSGAYYVSRWVVSPSDPGWTQDLTGSVATVNVHGDYIDFTDANGTPDIVRVDQPFVLSVNPATVLRIDATGNVFQMSQAHANAVRKPLK